MRRISFSLWGSRAAIAPTKHHQGNRCHSSHWRDRSAFRRRQAAATRPHLDLLRGGIDAHDGVPAAGAIRPDDDTVGSGLLAEWNTLDRTTGWVQSAGNAEILACVPILSAWPNRHIVRIVAFWHLLVLRFLSVARAASNMSRQRMTTSISVTLYATGGMAHTSNQNGSTPSPESPPEPVPAAAATADPAP